MFQNKVYLKEAMDGFKGEGVARQWGVTAPDRSICYCTNPLPIGNHYLLLRATYRNKNVCGKRREIWG
jgi:hypothetical protein